MNCALTNEQQRQLLEKVYQDLKNIAASDKDFNLNDFIISFHDTIMSATKDDALALQYAQLVPEFVNLALTGRRELVKTLRSKGLSRDTLEDTIVEFEDISVVEKLIKPKTAPEDLQGTVDSISNDLKKPKKPEPQKPEEVEKQSNELLKAIRDFIFKPFTALSSTGQQAAKVKDLTDAQIIELYSTELGVSPSATAIAALRKNKGNQWTTIKNPEESFYYDFFGVIAKQLKNNENAAEITINGFTGFGLKIIKKNKIAIEVAKPQEQRLVEGREGVSAEEGLELYNAGKALVVTSTDGDILYFDKDYNVVGKEAGGIPIYHHVRRVEKTADGKYIIKAHQLQNEDELAAHMFGTTKKAFQQLKRSNKSTYDHFIKLANKSRQDQLEMMYNIHQYVNDKGELQVDIAGVSRGVLDIRKQSSTSPESIDWANSDIEFNAIFADKGSAELGEDAGGVYLRVPNHRSIPYQRRNFEKADVDKLTSILLDDLYIVENGERTKIDASTRKRLFENFFITKYNTIQVFDTDGKWTFKVKGSRPISLDADADIKDRVRAAAETMMSTKYVNPNTKKATQYNTRPGQFALAHPADSVEFFEDFSIDGDTITIIPMTYEEHVKRSADLEITPNKQTGAEKENVITFTNGYFTFIVSGEEQNNIKAFISGEEVEVPVTTDINAADINAPVQEELTPEKKVDDPFAKKDVPDIDRTGLHMPRLIKMKSSPEQIKAAKQWFDKSPLSKHIGYEELFNVINSNAWGEFVNGGIKLYAGADHTVLYHEAFHAFTQHFLSKEEKQSLYKETAKLTEGKRAIKAWASRKKVSVEKLTDYEKDLAIEELLAEDFRKYVMSGGKKVLSKRPARNTIFRRLYNFLKRLFKGTSATTEATGLHSIKELYDKLYVGNLNEYSPSEKNARFTESALYSLKPVDGGTTTLSDQDTMLLVESMDSIISDYIDEQNSKAAVPGDTRFTSAIFTDPERYLPNVYTHVRNTFIDKRLELLAAAEKAEGLEKEALLRKISILEEGIINFGLEDLTEGLVAYHTEKSPFLSSEIKDLDKEAFQTTKSDIMATAFDKSGNEISMKEIASNPVLYLIKGLKEYDKEGQSIENNLGFNKLVDFGKTWKKLISTVVDSNETPAQIKEALMKGAETSPWMLDLLNKLGPVDTKWHSSFDLWTGFWAGFYFSEQRHSEVLINEIVNELGANTFEVLSGYASAVFRKVERDFKGNFKMGSHPNPFIKDSRTGNYLDVKAIVAKYKDGIKEGKEIEFLHDIGMPVTDLVELKEKLQEKIKSGKRKGKRRIGYEFMLDKLKQLDDKGVQVKDVISALKNPHKTVISIEGQEEVQTIPSETSNVNRILSIEAKYSGNYSNTSIITPTGNTAYEQSQMSSLAVMVKTLNSVKSYQELIAIPHMSYLDYSNNPHVTSSNLLRSLFEFNPATKTFGKRREGIDMIIDNLAGTQNIIDNSHSDKNYSVSTAQSDKYTRLMQDIYSLFLEGKPSGMTPGDKGTILSVTTNVILSGAQSQNSKLYVDTAAFTKKGANFNLGLEHTYKVMLPYLNAELARMKQVERHQTDPFLSNIDGFTVPDIDGNIRGLNFAIFEGMFSAEAKTQIKAAGAVENFSPELHTKLRKELNEYIKAETRRTSSIIDNNLFVDENLKDIIETEAGKKLKPKELSNTIMTSYVVNKIIHNIELSILFYGDLSQFKDLDKRLSGLNSTGRMFRTDLAALKHVNETLGRPFREKMIGDAGEKFKGTLNTVIFKENIVESNLLPEYTLALTEHYEKLGMTPAKAKAKAKKILKPYLEMEEGDGQGWITFDSYRIFSKLEDRWSPQQEKLFMQIVDHPESVDPLKVTEYFPPRKYQYFGPLAATGVHATAFHKYSLFPLVPSVVKGKNLEVLHNNMMKQNIDYALFKSGSKVGTQVAPGTAGGDTLYSDLTSRTVSTDTNYTKNVIYANYLKDQLDINSHFKGKVIFSTQLRKLIEEGLIEGSVPVDFMAGKSLDTKRKEWAKLTSETDKQKASSFYTMYKTYEDLISELVDLRMAELRKEIGSTESELAAGKGNMDRLVQFIQQELSRQDLTDHQINFIEVKDGKLVRDLSISPDANKIERALNAIVNNRLVRQKVNGESLVQVSTSLLEATNPTEEEREKWGTNDLQSYRKDPDTGNTLPMDVKVALQGGFKKLIKLTHKDGEPVVVYTERAEETITGEKKFKRELNEEKTLARLNETIQDPEWRANKDNLDMITMVGVRIPVQGLNSMEFMTVKEFLPVAAGNIIVAPSEIVAKSGADFDVDKLTIMMPSIKSVKDKPEVIRKDGGESIENALMFGIRDILALPHNFISLITPNDTSLVKPLADELSKNRDYIKRDTTTRYLEPSFNMHKHEENAIGKETLGQGAVDNTFNTIFNRIGAYINPIYKPRYGGQRRATILMKHNTLEILEGKHKGKEGISLSHLYDANGDTKIADIINQLMNGWVDVAKEAWIFDIQGNKQITPVLMFLIQSGVPFEQAVYFVSNPLIKKYVNEQKILTSAFAKAMNRAPQEPSFYKGAARFNVLEAMGRHDLLNFEEQKIKAKMLYDATVSQTKGKDFADTAEGVANMDEFTALDSPDAEAGFLHFLELEQIANGISAVKMTLNYDTSKSNTLYDAQRREADLSLLKKNAIFPLHIIEKILDESPISSFRVAPFQLELWGPLFKLRNHSAVNRFLIDAESDTTQSRKMKKIYGTEEKYVEEFKNDFVVKIFTDAIKDFDINLDTYKGLLVNNSATIEDVEHLDRGVRVAPNKAGELTVYIDQDILDKQFDRALFTSDLTQNDLIDNEINKMFSYDALGLAKVPFTAFMYGVKSRRSEYQRFVVEREYLRATSPFEEMSKTQYFDFRVQQNKDLLFRTDEEDMEAFGKRVVKTTYEEMLRDQALDNILNYWKMFMSDRTIADKFFEIQAMHPNMKTDFNIVNDLILSEGGKWIKDKEGQRVKGKSFKNLMFRDNRVDSDIMNIYYANMLDLSDSTKASISIFEDTEEQDIIENQRISEFFSMLPFAGFLQSGLNVTDSLSIMKAMPTDRIVDIIQEATPAVMKELNSSNADIILHQFQMQFNAHNKQDNISVRRRLKNYVSGETVEKRTDQLLDVDVEADFKMPMNFEINGKSALDQVISGDVTGRTGKYETIPEKGDIIELYKETADEIQSVLVRVTREALPVEFLTADAWAASEGSTPDEYNTLIKRGGYYQFNFEVMDIDELGQIDPIDIIEVSPKNKNQLESLIKNNPSVIFVLEGALNPTSKGYYAEGIGKIGTVDTGKIAPITLRNNLNDTADSLWKGTNSAENIRHIKESLDKLEELYNTDGVINLAFLDSGTGYGSYLLEPVAEGSKEMRDVEAYNYLTTELYKRFGYVNRHGKIVTELNDIMQKDQDVIDYKMNISDQEIFEAQQRLTCKF